MRDMVEIGMGRTARRTYELDDINIVPSRRTRSSKDVSTAWQLDAYRFDIPVLSHPTDALVSVEFAIELGRLLAGAVLTEQIFTIPGFGKLVVDAVFNRDYPVVQGVVLTTALIFVLLSLVADLLYMAINPRLRQA